MDEGVYQLDMKGRLKKLDGGELCIYYTSFF